MLHCPNDNYSLKPTYKTYVIGHRNGPKTIEVPIRLCPLCLFVFTPHDSCNAICGVSSMSVSYDIRSSSAIRHKKQSAIAKHWFAR